MNVNGAYGETISKPAFILREKEKEVFLNGEMQTQKKTYGFGEMGRGILMKKTSLCLKGLSVDRQLDSEALRNSYTLK